MEHLPRYDEAVPPPQYSRRVVIPKKSNNFNLHCATACICVVFLIFFVAMLSSLPNVIVYYNSFRVFPTIEITNENNKTSIYNCPSSFIVPTCIDYTVSNSGICNGIPRTLKVISKAPGYNFTILGGQKAWKNYCLDCRLFQHDSYTAWYSSLNSTVCGNDLPSDSDLMSVFYVCTSLLMLVFLISLVCLYNLKCIVK